MAAPARNSNLPKIVLTSNPELGYKGMSLLLNNNVKEAEELFKKYMDKFIQMKAGYCFLHVINAIMTFEEADKITKAVTVLHATENHCLQEIKLLQNVNKSSLYASPLAVELRLENLIITGDCEFCMGLLIMLHQDISSFVKGGWSLRKAFKIYEKTYREIKSIYDSAYSRVKQGSLDSTSSTEPKEKQRRHPRAKSLPRSSVTPETAHRLMCAVCSGFGLLHLAISLLPPNLVKLIHFLGFDGNRDVGLKLMMFSSKGKDMRAPIATLGLLWYHTILRSYLALDGLDLSEGIKAGQALIDQSMKEFSKSALFIFYHGRIHRLKSHLDLACTAYTYVVKTTVHKELQLLALNELGWCRLLQFDWKEAYSAFHRLKVEFQWTKSFYCYLSGLCLGLDKDLHGAKIILEEVPRVIKKHNHLDSFSLKRSQRILTLKLPKVLLMLFVMELIFIWQSIPNCSKEVKKEMLGTLDRINEKEFLPLKYLILGGVYTDLNHKELAMKYYQESIKKTFDSHEKHVAAYASYELGLLLIDDAKTQPTAQQFLRQAKSYSGYYFEHRLALKIHAAFKLLSRPQRK